MLKSFPHLAAVVTISSVAAICSGSSFANPMVGGAPMFENRNIVENVVNSKVHTTPAAAVKAAGLVETLSGTGPFTVFAPVNQGFEMLPAGTVETLLKNENKGTLTKVLTAHVVAGRISGQMLWDKAKANGAVIICRQLVVMR